MTRRLILTFFSACLLIACTKENGPTESQIKLSEAKIAQAELVDKANHILDTKLTGVFLNDLNHISYASEIALRAEEVFTDAKINIESENITALNERLTTYVSKAGLKAIELLHESVDTTVKFKKNIEDMPLQPLSSNSTSTSDGMVKFLVEQYSVDITACCISHLKDISIFLGQVDEFEHYALRRMIANVELTLSDLIKNPKHAKKYTNEINTIGEQYKYYQSELALKH